MAPTAPGPSVEPETRVPPTTAYDPDGSVSSPVQPPPSDPFVPPGTDPSLSACPPAEVAVTVATGKAAYAVGETVTGSSVLENRSSTACLVPARVRWAVQDLAGNDVSGFAYTADYALPVKAEPGQSFPGTFCGTRTTARGPVHPVSAGDLRPGRPVDRGRLVHRPGHVPGVLTTAAYCGGGSQDGSSVGPDGGPGGGGGGDGGAVAGTRTAGAGAVAGAVGGGGWRRAGAAGIRGGAGSTGRSWAGRPGGGRR